MRRSLRLALVAMLVLLVPASSAFAHGGNPNYRSVINEVTPSNPNVSFQVLNYDSYMQLLAQPGHEVVVYGYEGEPYARILKNGTVQVNERSPALYLNENRFAEVTPPPIANAKAPPKWKTFDHSASFIWHDHRMHYMSPTTPAKVKDTSKKTKIFNYEIPIRVDGKKGAVHGTLFWVGPASTSKTPFIIAGILIVLIGGALVLFVRRRRRDEDDGEGDVPLEPAKEAW
jgi:LPXTG-motif cell wall-anchored protein